MTDKTPESILADIMRRDTAVLSALLNAHLGDQPLNAALRKESAYSPHVNDNGKVLPLTAAALDLLLKQPEWANHPMVKAALATMEPKPAEKWDDNTLVSKATTSLKELVETDLRLLLWTAYYTNNKVLLSFDEERFRDGQSKKFTHTYLNSERMLMPMLRKAMDNMVADGSAPSREILGLEKVHEITLRFSTAAMAKEFLAKWSDSIAKRLATLNR